MTWKDSDQFDDGPFNDFGKPGGDWHGMRPRFDNPMSWSLRIGTISGITVRVHFILLIIIVAMLLKSLAAPSAVQVATMTSFTQMCILMASLFLIILCHEFGHCIACRAVGGVANEILMWPLGGLARCMPPNRWTAHFWTVAGGPLVNVVIWFLAGTMLLIDTGVFWGVAVPNPIDPLGPVYDAVLVTWPGITLYIINWISFMLLLFNLLPIFPLDGGQLLQSLLWPYIGYARSMRIAVRVGLVGAILLAVGGLVLGEILLLCIAAFGLFTCYVTGKQLAFTEGFMGYEYGAPDDLGDGLQDDDTGATGASGESRTAVKERKRAEADQDALDAILAKIQNSGMDSLTRKEKRLLERMTREKRKGEE